MSRVAFDIFCHADVFDNREDADTCSSGETLERQTFWVLQVLDRNR